MIRINLLPPEYEQAEKKKEAIVLGSGAGIIVMVILLMIWMVQKSRAAALEVKIQQAQAELQTFQTIIEEIKAIEADKRRAEEKLGVIKNLNRTRLVYPVFFEDFIPIVPADVWVTSMNLDEKTDRINISMACKATSNFAIATWLTNLQQSPHFSDLKLGPIGYQKSDQTTILTYNLDCVYRHSGPMPLSEYY